MHSGSWSRRGLLKAGGAGALLLSLPEWFVEETLDAAQAKPPKSANDKPNIALIGCGGRGRVDAHESEPFGNIVAVCDVYERHAQGAMMEFGGPDRVKAYTDFRKLLERDDIHCIINGTPDHWHTLVNLAALKAGKDIYSEKPLTLTVDEGRRLVDAIRKSDRILQTGTQQRSDPTFRLACELVRNGRIGKLQEVSVILPAGLYGGPFKSRPVPESLDWDFWQGQTPQVDYMPERGDFRFRYWYEYSGGTMTDWGAHHNDIVLWALDVDGPVEINGKPSIDMIPGGYTAYSQYHVEYTYTNGVRHHCFTTLDDMWSGGHVRNGAGTLHNGIRFDGSHGWIWVSRGEIQASKPEIIHEPLPSNAIRLYASNNHKANFYECVRTRKQPICPAEVGHRSASACHIGAISIRLGRRLHWDLEAQQFVNDAEANKMLSRPQRAPYTYEMVS